MSGNTRVSNGGRRPYEAPSISPYSAQEILSGLGPAVAIYGNPNPNP